MRNNSLATVRLTVRLKATLNGGVVADDTDLMSDTNFGPGQSYPFLIQTDGVILFFAADGTVLYIYRATSFDGANSTDIQNGDQVNFTISPYALPRGATSYHLYARGEGGLLIFGN